MKANHMITAATALEPTAEAMLIAVFHSLTPIAQGVGIALTILAGLGLIFYAIALSYTKLKAGRKDATKEITDEYKELVEVIERQNEILQEQNKTLNAQNKMMGQSVDFLTEKVTNLEGSLSRLAEWLVVLSCANAPTCERRNCPHRETITKMIEGEISPHRQEDIAAIKETNIL